LAGVINNRYTYIQELRMQESWRLDIFKDASSVEDLVRRQVEAQDMSRRAEPGWQEAMKRAGLIWSEETEGPEDTGSRRRPWEI
jgi:hypothetical protein